MRKSADHHRRTRRSERYGRADPDPLIKVRLQVPVMSGLYFLVSDLDCRFSSFLSLIAPLSLPYAGLSPICRPGVSQQVCHFPHRPGCEGLMSIRALTILKRDEIHHTV